MPKSSQVLGPRNHTNPLIWFAAIICALLAVVVIIAGAVAFVGYLTIKPKVPQISVTSAQLDSIYFDQATLLTLQVTIVIRAKNGNAKARASFDDTRFGLSFRGMRIANLVNEPFGVGANSSVEFHYVSQSTPIPLNPEQAEAVNVALRQRTISFELVGSTRTRWRVGIVGSVKFWLHLNCRLHLPIDRTPIYPRCTSSKSR